MEIAATHANTDFDALASLVAAGRLYPGAYLIAPQKPNRNVREFLTLYGDELRLFEPGELPCQPVTCVILVDTQHLPKLEALGLARAEQFAVVVYDHHPRSPELPTDAQFYTAEVGATSTLMVELLSSLDASLSEVEATLLLAGIYEDTGHLTFPDTTARDLRAAAWLLEQGANLQMVQRMLTHVITFHQRQIFEDLVRSAETYQCHDHAVTVATAVAPGTAEELSVLASHLMSLLEPEALFLLIKLDGHIQVIARSRTEEIDVGAVLAELGGGGHARAAAALVKMGDLDRLKEQLRGILDRKVAPALTVAQIMLRRFVSLGPEVSAASAHEEMLRTGIPLAVVTGPHGDILGVVSRRDVDRAIHHGLADQPLKTFLRRRPALVSPNDPVAKARALMAESDLTALPVVENSRIVGTVLATDILRTWPGAPQPGATALEIGERLEKSYTPALMGLVRQIGLTAAELGFRAYLVGGVVRDLLLGIPNFDIDIVVEGDAIKLAKAVAAARGLRVIVHPRFGTAKLDLSSYEGVPRDVVSLDLATARTEYYARPGALPTVQPSSLRLDLLRRDFTINTLAVSLSPSSFGRVIDHFGGLRDLDNKLVRVLHNFSFVEDPTRMLRAARLEARLHFRVEERTEELIRHAVELRVLNTVSRERLFGELTLIMQESEPELALKRLADWGLLQQMHPHLGFDSTVANSFQRARLEEMPASVLQATYFCLLAIGVPLHEHDALAANLGLQKEHRKAVLALAEVVKRVEKLLPEVDPGDLVVALDELPEASLRAVALAWPDERISGAVRRYLTELRHVRPATGGEYLKRLGLPPGPIYRKLLTELLKQKVRGVLPTVKDEERWLSERVEALRASAG
jgi:tRNA nucleotidyltransferase (CCA-adding enzyme)